jgi:hypothetical protein
MAEAGGIILSIGVDTTLTAGKAAQCDCRSRLAASRMRISVSGRELPSTPRWLPAGLAGSRTGIIEFPTHCHRICPTEFHFDKSRRGLRPGLPQ